MDTSSTRSQHLPAEGSRASGRLLVVHKPTGLPLALKLGAAIPELGAAFPAAALHHGLRPTRALGSWRVNVGPVYDHPTILK